MEKKALFEILVPTMRNDGRPIRTRPEMDEIIAMTMKYYDQLAVLAYKVSDEVILRHADGTGNDIG
jgi:hypothetical protein